MTEQDHRELLTVLNDVEAKVILSGYLSDLYKAMLQPRRWHQIPFDLPNNAAGGKAKRRMTECLWLNCEAPVK
jgi:DNA adenine methylase